MSNPSFLRQLGLFLALVVLLSLTLLFEWRYSSASSATQPFLSVVRPDPATTSTATTPIPSTFLSVLPTPTGQVVATPTPPVAAPHGESLLRAWIPFVRNDAPPLSYEWKGVADSGEVPSAKASNGFWGLNPGWYYNWGYGGPWTAAHLSSPVTAMTAVEQMDAAMQDPAYVPMIWCTDDVWVETLSPETAATLAREHPGRVWLVFNEPDIALNSDNCGYRIDTAYESEAYFNGLNYDKLGKYLAKQYIRYHDAITKADPSARLFAFGGARSPGGDGDNDSVGRTIWSAFVSYLANPKEELDKAPRILHGIAVHTYPVPLSTGCSVKFTSCLQRVLPAAHNFFQEVSGTAAKPIWITEIGRLEAGGSPPGSVNGREDKQKDTASNLTEPLLAWFANNAIPEGGAPYYNGVAWFSTHDCRPYNDKVLDITASDLLDIGAVDCPLTAATQPTAQRLTAIGQLWSAAQCPTCACPGLDCR